MNKYSPLHVVIKARTIKADPILSVRMLLQEEAQPGADSEVKLLKLLPQHAAKTFLASHTE